MYVKCKKCRIMLLNDQCLIDIHKDPILEDAQSSTHNYQSLTNEDLDQKNTLLYIDYEKAPAWILSIIDQASWTAGKLTCLKCSCKVGSFNFLDLKRCPCCKVISPCVWLIQSKVDAEVSVINVTKSIPHLRKESSVRSKHQTFLQSENSDQTTESQEGNQWMDNDDHEKEVIQTINDLAILKKEKQIALHKLQRDKESMLICSDKRFSTMNTCTICMDIYFRPVRCMPCKHRFCESCLKQWHHYSKGYWCPICRQLIMSTTHLQKLDSKLSIMLPLMYEEKRNSRQKYEKYKLPKMTKQAYEAAQALQNANENDNNVDNEGMWELQAGQFFRRFEYGYIWLNVVVVVVCIVVSTIHFLSSYF